MRARWNLLKLMVAGPLLVACTATFIVQQYEGPPLPPESVSILRLNGQEPAVLAALDGEALGFSLREQQARVHVEMQPGIHEIQAGNRNDPRHRVMLMRFEAEPGAVYRIEVRQGVVPRRPLFTTTVSAAGTPDSPWDAAVLRVDRDGDQPLSEVALLPPVEARELGTAGSMPPAPRLAPVATTPVATTPVVGTAMVGTAAASASPSPALPATATTSPTPPASPAVGASAGSATIAEPAPPAPSPGAH